MFVFTGFLAGPLSAVDVSITNPSFEQPGTGTEVTVWDSIPGWDSNPSDNGLYKGYNPTDGAWTCYEHGNSYTVFQVTTHTIQSDVTYYLTLDAKAQAGSGVQITMSCWKGPEWGSKTLITSSDFSVGSSMAEKQISFDSSGHSGQTLIIGFECTGSDSGHMIAVDNVRVTYSTGAETDPPSPDPMTWASVPSADSFSAISMTATTATDPSGVEYYFYETSANPGGSDSGWQDSTSYTDTGLSASTQYCYEVQARDKSPNQNLTAWSTNQCATTQSGGGGGEIPLTNPSFESGTTGWGNATVGTYEYYAAPDGADYATRSSTAGYATQLTGHTIAAGETFTLKVWARTIYSDSHTEALMGPVSGHPPGNNYTATAEARFYYGSNTITSTTLNTNPKAIQGAPQTVSSDDGANIWVDTAAGYRHAFSQVHFYQSISSDPIDDPWYLSGDNYDQGQCDSGAKGPVLFNSNKWIYGSNSCNPYCCGSGETCKATLFFEPISGGDPSYSWGTCDDQTYIFWHSGDEDPWLADGQVYYDPDTTKLWMIVGGGTGILVVELDSTTGYVKGYSSCIEYDTHTSEFTQVADWNGDEWTDDSQWFEGPAIYKHNGYWYCFTSNGDLSATYTIRVGRGSSPTGPFYDKEGDNMNVYDSGEAEYGNSFVLGDDSYQLCPGQPHIWEENGVFYMGYDYIEQKESAGEEDIFAIRRLYWENDWPTIWHPITLTFNADDHPASIGQEFGISLRNTGQSGSYVAFDHVYLEYTEGASDTDPPTPDPMTWASVPTADDQDSISMTATTASDPSGVEYYFDETSGNPGGTDSGWQDNTNYTDTGLNSGTQYCYEVAARDKSANQNETAASTNQCATTDTPDTTPPTPDPMTWATLPHATGSSSIDMTATTATDPSGVQYYFDETSANPGGSDSGWQSSPSYTDTGLDPLTQYTYTVKARDVSPNYNETAASTAESATTEAVPPEVSILGSWTSGTSHTAEAGSARALIFTAHTEDDNTDMNASVTYGGQSMTKIIEENYGTGYRAYVAAFILDEAGIAAASGSTFNVTWAQTPSRTPGYSSVFLEGVDQADLIGASAGNGNTSSPIATSALATSDGDMVVVAGAVGATGSYTCDNGFTEALEVTVESGDGVAGYKTATGADEWVQLTHTNVNRQVIIGFVVQATTAAPDTTPPTPDPMTWATTPYSAGTSSIAMEATTATDENGVEYYFYETSGNPGGSDSGWQDSTSYTDTGLNSGTQYCYEVQARDKSPNQNLTNWSTSECATTDTPDTTPPTPDPMTWQSVPSAGSDTEVSMTATTATDPSGVEYFFDETSGNPGGSDSGWQAGSSYTDTGLTGSTQYCYRVQARDQSPNQNTTAWSSPDACATTQATPDTTPPTPDPMTWDVAPVAGGTDNISMTASTATDPSGVEYSFDETSGNPGGTDSGWQDSVNYTDTGLNASTQYCYRVQARDKSANQNATAWSTTDCATTDAPPDTTPPAPDPATWASVPSAGSDTQISMTATTATDPSGVEYFFDETSGNPGGSDSAWQVSASYTDSGLTASTQYCYRVRARDLSVNQNATAWSSPDACATTQATPDTDPPTPNPATWAAVPAAGGTDNISMTATTGTDPSGVQYFFDETTGGAGATDSGWQASSSYTDSGLSPDTQYTYRVRMRDESPNQNTGSWSTSESATTDPLPQDTDPPTPNPATWSSVPSADSDTAISMTATTGSDPSGVQYSFDETSGNPGGSDSGWQSGTSYTDSGLNAETQYCYRVRMRDQSANQNTGSWSTTNCATTDASKGSCGAAPMYRDGVLANVSVMSSFSHALLPLIPSLLTLGLWTVVKRKED